MQRTASELHELRSELARFRADPLLADAWGPIAAADRVLMEMAAELVAAPREMDLPDDSGFWWMGREAELGTSWTAVEVIFLGDDELEGRCIRWSAPGDGRTWPCRRGRWLKITPPPEPTKGT